VYNAHLDAVHAGLNAATAQAQADGAAGGKDDEDEVKYVSLGGGEEGRKVLSRAEQASVNKRVRAHGPPLSVSARLPLGRSRTDAPVAFVCAARGHRRDAQGGAALVDQGQEGRRRRRRGLCLSRLARTCASLPLFSLLPASMQLTQRARPQTYIEEAHLRKALEGTRPSVPADELVRLRKMCVFSLSPLVLSPPPHLLTGEHPPRAQLRRVRVGPERERAALGRGERRGRRASEPHVALSLSFLLIRDDAMQYLATTWM